MAGPHFHRLLEGVVVGGAVDAHGLRLVANLIYRRVNTWRGADGEVRVAAC